LLRSTTPAFSAIGKTALTVARLRADAICRTLFPPLSLKAAINRLGFVQADPIRSPARAQDLILRHRVKNYRAGDLERRYPLLDIEEDFLYAYGFLPRRYWSLLHPRDTAGLSSLEQRVLALVREHSQIHPRDLEAHLGKRRTQNAWGGYSKATTHALHKLHYRGLLRVGRRDNGIRIYEPATPPTVTFSPADRLKLIVLLLAGIFAPVPLQSLREILRFLPHAAPHLEGRSQALQNLLQAGELVSAEVDGLTYIWPAGALRRSTPPVSVRFLAPFDPLVWDRRRFEYLWGWKYRFEAYTPVAKRQLGYYAMPLLWIDSVIGWANVSLEDKRMKVKLGFIGEKPSSPEFKHALEEEIERLRTFLHF
jgi:uncharacterized protein